VSQRRGGCLRGSRCASPCRESGSVTTYWSNRWLRCMPIKTSSAGLQRQERLLGCLAIDGRGLPATLVHRPPSVRRLAGDERRRVSVTPISERQLDTVEFGKIEVTDRLQLVCER